MSSSMNNWRKLKIELVPEAERAFILICQGLFKMAALAGFSVLLAKKCKISVGMLKAASKFCYKHTMKTQHKVSGGYVDPTGSLKITMHSVFMLFLVSKQPSNLLCRLLMIIVQLSSHSLRLDVDTWNESLQGTSYSVTGHYKLMSDE